MRSLAASVERFALRRLLQLPASWQAKISGQPAIQIDGLTLHPEIQLLLAAWKWRGGAKLRADTPLAARASFRAETLRHPIVCELKSVSDFDIPAGTNRLRVRHYGCEAEGAPLLVYFHGGGFVLGDLDTHDAPCRLLCRHAAMHVLAIDYRLAPEHPFPAATGDAIAAFGWAARHAAELGADPSRLYVGGDSAGGNLATVVAQHAASTGGPAPAAQLLIYPCVDLVQEARSIQLFGTGLVLDGEDRAWFMGHYLSAGAQRRDVRLSPLRVDDASGLCPSFIVTAGFDPLRDEGEAYACKLAQAGVRTLLRRYDGFVHGFLNMVGPSPASRDIVIEIAAAFGAFVRDLQAEP